MQQSYCFQTDSHWLYKKCNNFVILNNFKNVYTINKQQTFSLKKKQEKNNF